MDHQTTPIKTPIDVERTCATILDAVQPEADPVLGAFNRGFNAGLRSAIHAVRIEAEVEAYHAARGVERAARVERVANFADGAYEGWTSGEVSYERG